MSDVEKRYQAIWGDYDGEQYVTITRLGGHEGWDTLDEVRAEMAAMTPEGEDYPEIMFIEDTWAGYWANVVDNALADEIIVKDESAWLGLGQPAK